MRIVESNKIISPERLNFMRKFDRKEVFGEIDKSNQRFNSYSKKERKQFRKIAKKVKSFDA